MYRHRNKDCKEPIIPHDIPSYPFHKLACDILEHAGKPYLVVVDYYSKWLELKEMRNKTAREINAKWLEIIVVFGVPKIVIADNNPFEKSSS